MPNRVDAIPFLAHYSKFSVSKIKISEKMAKKREPTGRLGTKLLLYIVAGSFVNNLSLK